MKFAPVFAAVALAAATATAHAEVSSTVTVASDYDFRGITQTARDPALQISLDWASESGFYLGAWASNVDFGEGAKSDAEVDLLGGFRGSINDDTAYDIGIAHYTFQPNDDDVDFTEAYASLTYQAVTAKYWYAWDFGNSGSAASYLELNGALPLPNDFSLTLHGGYSAGEYWEGEEYFDYSIGIAKEIGNFSVALKWIDGSDLQSAQVTEKDVFTSEQKVFFSVSTTLPWGE